MSPHSPSKGGWAASAAASRESPAEPLHAGVHRNTDSSVSRIGRNFINAAPRSVSTVSIELSRPGAVIRQTGGAGIWGRWEQYAKTGHGHNQQLVDLLAKHAGHAKHFRFSILRTLSKTLTRKEVIGMEALYKKKLGTRAFGLNSN